MNAKGVVRKIDDLGRIVIPKEIRDSNGLPSGTPMEMFVDEDRIVLRKYEPGCVLCGSVQDLEMHKSGKLVCKSCL
ncbi:AbrB/MazE/SpoVT family DNA-binding domain-containing protein [Brevibacillus laterosporus]|uniref:AbrB/MazE/SpoVT family DNA-binding domain-containing protein n=1 Tax=Brevibacillus laterosporus TaxID=1465 RepID=A0AAP3DER5_BRELA|nr:AbrB/MazE/SpoVT family DNA-binding domain-containing protein [Brevibacillus laterosporus]MCR8979506.1 AbrB/MazE/SpoVT family DNA-binding domain-containing protein [Brevibacillus laterosporus]MCZ0806661.1 AbrB/MazE/SpoVT family DNA-binding domain-containing protein [Brevibacillus laterosporus]MCZ0825109.1 AbrB/MazE/SpoVT family DNA-binding domain-containing protein [Brevibacillus laterosporus]MCZ0852053.1 AbrB/MazE/SpoVT family DNA-binding domain-containing protein [Brevibacillus laterosporus